MRIFAANKRDRYFERMMQQVPHFTYASSSFRYDVEKEVKEIEAKRKSDSEKLLDKRI